MVHHHILSMRPLSLWIPNFGNYGKPGDQALVLLEGLLSLFSRD